MDAVSLTSDPPAPLLAEEEVLSHLWRWRQQGLRAALVTLVGIEGTAPRPLGAQMAVAEDGRYAGYLSGGCLEQAVVLEAIDVLSEGRNRLVRYGRGSRYFDVRLPCGSGIDLYFDCALPDEILADAVARIEDRRSFVHATNLVSGTSTLRPWETRASATSERSADDLLRVHRPHPRLLLLGSGPSVAALGTLAAATGLETEIWSPDAVTRARVHGAGLRCFEGNRLSEEAMHRLDASTAVVVMFHDHDIEPPLLMRLLAYECFYIGVLGNRAVHRQRLAALAELGVGQRDRERLRAPLGMIQGAKSKATLAVGILAELMAEAKARYLVA